jgi:hypothetical protein
MHLPLPAQEFERTCADCGHIWRVARALARRRFQSISGLSTGVRMRGSAMDPRGLDASLLNAQVRAIEELGQQTGAFRSCPQCNSRQFTQRPVRRAR